MIVDSVLFTTYLMLSILSCIPTSAEERARAFDLETAKIGHYRPERNQPAAANQAAWKASMQEQQQQHHLQIPPRTPVAATPRTVAFRTLEGGSVGTGAPPSARGNGALPFREIYDVPDGR